jgi:peptidoglycan/xylan/chitin deacetylase (PgdA/CDA1 family)
MRGESEFHIMSTSFPRAALSLSFDDARISEADIGLPVLDEQNAKATFYVSFGSLEQRLDAWKNTVKNGHEIGNHTISHPCSGNFAFSAHNALEDYTLERMEAELTGANAKIEALLGVTPRTFAYPCGQTFVGRGENLRSYIPLVAKHFRAGRAFRSESANQPNFCDFAQLHGVDGDNQSFDELMVWVEKALRAGEWLIFCGHEIGIPTNQTFCANAMAQLCEFARDNGIWLDTVATINEHVRRVRAV